MKTRLRHVNNHGIIYTALMFACPGCAEMFGHGDGLHSLPVNSPGCGQPSWEWNGDLNVPTLSPSIRSSLGPLGLCHSFLRNGVFEFLKDSTHSLAGEFVPMPDLPLWVKNLP